MSGRAARLARCAILVAVLSPDAFAGAQTAAPAPSRAPAPAGGDTSVLARIRDEGFNRSQLLETAVALSDGFGPRLAGSPQYRAAAEWARARLASFGLANARLEPWGIRGGRSWAVTRQSVELTAPYYARITAYPKAWSPPTAGVVRGTPVLATVRTEEDVARLAPQLRGRIVLNGAVLPDTGGGDAERWRPLARRFTDAELDSLERLTDPGEPKDYWDDAGGYAENVRRGHRVAVALGRAGVAAVLEPSRNRNAVLVSGYQAYDSDVSEAVPAFVVARGDYARLVNLVRLADSAGAGGGAAPPTLELRLDVASAAPRSRADSTGYNVVAELPGSDPAARDEVVMVGGHFDAWTAGTGATDNAAGSAVAMEALRILKAVGAAPRRTLRVALWDGEEHEDYYGSLGYVRQHLGDPETMRLKPGHGRVSAYFNFDNGTGRVRGVYLQGNAAARAVFAPMLAPLADLGAGTLTIKSVGSTDHMPFVGVGVPAFTFIQDPIAYDPLTHHTDADVAANLLPDDLKQAAVVTAAILYQTANLPERVPRLPLPAPRAAAKVTK